MKALTVWQPWASLIIVGAKPFEFRGRSYLAYVNHPEPGERIALPGARPVRRGGVTSAAVAAAQAAAVNGTTAFAGGNLDSLGSSDRLSDDTHLNDTGMASAATLIYNAMHASGAPF